MLTAKDAAAKAATYLKDLIPNASGIQLEEIESVDKDQYWAITLSYYDPEVMFGGKSYKVLKVRKSNGEVVSMKIRSVR